jgi:hypothetical protein
MSSGPYRAFLNKLQVMTPLQLAAFLPSFEIQSQTLVESRLLLLPQHEDALTSAASSRCIALRPRCRAAAISIWSQRLLQALNTKPELLLLLPPAALPGSFLTVMPDAADACVRALVAAINAAPPSQRAELLRVSVSLFVLFSSACAVCSLRPPPHTSHSQFGTPFLLRLHVVFARLPCSTSHSLAARISCIAHNCSGSIGRRERARFHSQKWAGAVNACACSRFSARATNLS